MNKKLMRTPSIIFRRVSNLAVVLFLSLMISNHAFAINTLPYVSLSHKEATGSVEVKIDGQFFTAYIYANPSLNKPVLFPVISAGGKTITRGYPLDTRAGERVDHTHHHGIWFNHGDVNGIDFWNAGRTPPKPNVRYGRIQHKSIDLIESGNTGTLVVSKEWLSDEGEIILTEQTTYHFQGDQNQRSITHSTQLTATNKEVLFKDSKEGLFAIRVARELEIASTKATILTDLHLKPRANPIVDNTNVSGQYLNSEGIKGYPAVWGKRAEWMQLSGEINNTPISLIIFDAPSNINHPAHWMARDYGLFAVNSLGSNIYTEGQETLNFRLNKSESKIFKYKIIISDGKPPDNSIIKKWYNAFVAQH